MTIRNRVSRHDFENPRQHADSPSPPERAALSARFGGDRHGGESKIASSACDAGSRDGHVVLGFRPRGEWGHPLQLSSLWFCASRESRCRLFRAACFLLSHASSACLS